MENEEKIIEVNLNQMSIFDIADISIFGKVQDVLPKIWQKVRD